MMTRKFDREIALVSYTYFGYTYLKTGETHSNAKPNCKSDFACAITRTCVGAESRNAWDFHIVSPSHA